MSSRRDSTPAEPATPSSSKNQAQSMSKKDSKKPTSTQQPLVIVAHPTHLTDISPARSGTSRTSSMEPYPGLLSMLENQHRINRYQTMEIASLRTQTTALTEQMTAAAAGLTAAESDRREAIARYDLLHADFAIKVTQLQHLRKALEQRNAAIRLQQEQIAALEKKVLELQQEAQPGAALPSPEADATPTPPSVMTPPPSRGRLSQLAASSVPNLPAQLAKFSKELRRKASSDQHTTSPREKYSIMREPHHQSAPRETVREVPAEEGENKPMTLPSRLLKRATMRNQLENQVWPQHGQAAKERAEAEEAKRAREEEGRSWPLR
ncbi:hypothetical protein MBLNU457_3714t1 [Dothideomycetes sp. NU457]